jgi:uncharacterized protein
MADVSLLGRMLWYELLTTDVAAAEKFYTTVVGWTVKPFDNSPQPYRVWTRAGGAGVGGVMPIPVGMKFPPHWGMYVGVSKLEETVAHVEQLGGSALSGVIDIPKVGRMRTMKDPQGAAFSLLEVASPERQPEVEAEMGGVSWHELYTNDAGAAMTFYAALFGWRLTGTGDMGAMGIYRMFGRAFTLGGMTNKPPAMAQLAPFWGFYFRVPDIHAAAQLVKANGGQVMNGPREVQGGDWIVNCLDPQGAAFSLHRKK